MKVTGNVKYIPAGTTQYVIDGNDGEINVDTSVSAITVILPNIVNSGYANSDKGFIINDFSGNAATNNITIIASNNTVNSQASITISVDGGTAKCSIASLNEWFAVTEPTTNGGISGTLTPNYIPKAQSASVLNDSIIYQSATGIGIGTIIPQTKLQVTGTNGLALITSARYSSDTNGAGFIGAKARGTEAAPTAVLAGDFMLTLNSYGYNSGGAFSTSIGKMVFYAAENFTASAQGTAFKLSTTPIGATVDVFNFGISPAGNVSIGDTTLTPTARLHVTGVSATVNDYAFKVDNLASVPLLYVRNDVKVSIGKVATTTTLDILGDSTNELFKLNNPYGLFSDKVRIDNDGSFYSSSDNTGIGNAGTGNFITGHLNYTFKTSYSTYLAFTNAQGAGNKSSYGIIGATIASSDSDYKLLVINTDNSTLGSVLKVVSTGATTANDAFNYTNYGINVVSAGVFTNNGAGTFYKVGVNLDITNGDVNRAINIENGLIRVVKANQPAYGTLTAGDFYYDTAANILANADFVVGMKA